MPVILDAVTRTGNQTVLQWQGGSGLYQLHPDGTLQLDGRGLPIPTYTQTAVTNFARVFTGWNFQVMSTFPTINYRLPLSKNAAKHERVEQLHEGVTGRESIMRDDNGRPMRNT